jgi:hypothetical protein
LSGGAAAGIKRKEGKIAALDWTLAKDYRTVSIASYWLRFVLGLVFLGNCWHGHRLQPGHPKGDSDSSGTRCEGLTPPKLGHYLISDWAGSIIF